VLTKIQPDEVYNLAGQSSVSLSFEQPVETESITTGTLNLLAIRFTGALIKLTTPVPASVLGMGSRIRGAMYLMLQGQPDDYAIATGEPQLETVAAAFAV